MLQEWHSHRIDFPETFELRRPVLAAASTLQNRWRVSDDGKTLDLDLSLSDYSSHERDLIEFAINPLAAVKIFGGLDRETQQVLATAIYKIFG